MSSDVVMFYTYALVAVAGALGLVLASRLIHAVMSLFATLFAIAALYLLLGSEFLAAMQLFVYGGAITVLVLFVLILTRPAPEGADRTRKGTMWTAGGVCALFFGVLAITLGRADFRVAAGQSHDAASLASILFSRYVLPFEIAGLVLTIALIGAIVLAREDDVLDTPSDLPEGARVPGTMTLGEAAAAAATYVKEEAAEGLAPDAAPSPGSVPAEAGGAE
ncbi:MAG: NADH-quinone oxidoreductase subunit J [Coriobacteriales bacterium]|nr:NADH-quinone oxidoreductase subunit J [Coriobacteriales bacterium]